MGKGERILAVVEGRLPSPLFFLVRCDIVGASRRWKSRGRDFSLSLFILGVDRSWVGVYSKSSCCGENV